MPDNVIKVVNDMGKQERMPNGIQFRNIHHKSTLVDLFAYDDLHNANSCAFDTDWNLSKNPKEDLKKITFDNHANGSEVQDLNIDNEGILHLYDGLDLSRNLGVQHEQEDQHNHFSGPIVDKHQPDEHLKDHVKDDNIDKEVGKVVQANEEVHVVGGDESSTDENFDMAEHDDQHDKSEEDSVYESAKEDNA